MKINVSTQFYINTYGYASEIHGYLVVIDPCKSVAVTGTSQKVTVTGTSLH